jgi:hypothetical protein
MGGMERETTDFPRELSGKEFDERHSYFLEYKAKHAMLNYMQRRVLDAILHPGEAGAIVIVLGPTGVGKTTLRFGLEEALDTRFEKEKQQDPSLIPSSGIDAPAPYNKTYRWKAHFKRALQSLKDPFVDNRNGSIDDLQLAYEKAVVNRHLRAFFIDDGQHMTGAKDAVGQFDMVKSMANTSKVLHVVLGTYELIPFLTMSGQLARRSIWFDFNRYRLDKKGIEVYGNVVDDFQRHLPLPVVFDMQPHLEFLYERTIGCVGVLKSWFVRALDLTLKHGGDSLTLKTLEETSLKDDQLNRMLDEALDGEQQIRGFVGKSSRARLRKRLEMGNAPTTPPDLSSEPTAPAHVRPGRKTKPLHRKLKRDPSFAARKEMLEKSRGPDTIT